MSGRSFWRQSRDRLSIEDPQPVVHPGTLGEQTDVPLPNIQFVNRNRTPSGDVLLHVPLSSSNQYVNRDAAVRIRDPTFDTVEFPARQFRRRPSISLTPSDNAPTNYDSLGCFYLYGANPTSTAFSECLPVPPSPKRPAGASRRRRGSTSSTRSSTDLQRSIGISLVNKQKSVLDLPNFRSAFGSDHSSAATTETREGPMKAATNEER